MNQAEKLKAKLLSGQGFHNFSFADAVLLLKSLGFVHSRTHGSHAFFTHAAIPTAIVNIQNAKGKAKAYQLRQIKNLVETLKL
jgi:predicted RNA binding protein YcfA (HicA-like mRNA interferase family)